jgi:phosphoribosylanthranilate isomerase
VFRIKICGITSVDDGLLAAAAGADAVGLNFYHRSPRSVSLDTATEIVDALPRHVASVGVFVDARVADIRETATRLRLDFIQLHGDEPPEFLAQLRDHLVIRAVRLQSTLEAVAGYLAKCPVPPAAVLIDAHVRGQYGGTGRTLDWSALDQHSRCLPGIPLILAGGLTPENVGQAISVVRPAAVDTASGVERAPGRKDAELVRTFVAAANAAFSA